MTGGLPSRALVVLVLAIALAATSRFSAASFSAASANPGATIGAASDWVPPAVTLTAPADGAFLNVAAPVLTGAAGTAPGDAAAVTARLWSGTQPSGTPLQTPTATVTGATWRATPTALPDGTYTARATQSDAGANVGASAAHTFTIDTVAPRVSDVQSADGGGGAGHMASGDSLTFTFSEPMDPASILAGWDGTATSVRAQVSNAGGKDALSILAPVGSTATVKLGSVATGANYVNGVVTFAATMARSGADVVITFGAPDLPLLLRPQAAKAQTLVWTPATGPTDRATNPLSATPATATQSGGAQVNF